MLGYIFIGYSLSGRFGRTAEKIITGYIIIIRCFYKKVKPAFSYAFFIVRKQRLRYPKSGSSAFLTYAASEFITSPPIIDVYTL